MKVRHRFLGWNGEVLQSRTLEGSVIHRILWQNTNRAWKTYETAKDLIFVVKASSRKIDNA